MLNENDMPESYRAWLKEYRGQLWGSNTPTWPCPSCGLPAAYYWRERDAAPDGKWRCSHCDPMPAGTFAQVTAGIENSSEENLLPANELLAKPGLFSDSGLDKTEQSE